MHLDDDASATDPLERLVDALPKAELHVHLEGSVAPATLLELATRHGTTALPTTLDGLAEHYRFRDFDHFVRVYYEICDNLRTAEDFSLITRQLGTALAAQGVVWAEVTVTPYNHMRRGVSPEAVFAGLEDGRRAVAEHHGVELRWCTDAPGEFGPAAAIETAQIVRDLAPDGVISFGLGGPEIGVPRSPFAEAFAMARDAGLHSVPHSGETSGPQAVWDALDHLGAERIGHGIRSIDDPELMARLREEQIALEVCPTSNVRLGVAPTLEDHPLRALIDAEVVVTLNSDDPPMFDTTLRDEHLVAVRRCGLSVTELVDVVRAGITTSFMPDAAKLEHLATIDDLSAGLTTPS